MVDAFGAGERAIVKALGEYHGEMTGALLLPIGRPLSGIQVYENMRDVDYLRSRAEVGPQRIGITGASGGGKQSMYAGTFDERFAAAVPVCSVGNYRAYLGAACCMCEVVPGALAFTEEGDLLGLAAPRGLMVINATRDARQLSVDEAKKSLARADDIFRLLDRADHVRHTVIDSAHDYKRPMREAMYGWMTRHLKQQGDGSPVPEPAIQTVCLGGRSVESPPGWWRYTKRNICSFHAHRFGGLSEEVVKNLRCWKAHTYRCRPRQALQG